MQKTLGEIARLIDGQVIGDEQLEITGINGIQESKPGDITFLADSKFVSLAEVAKASAFIISKGMVLEEKSVVVVDNPSAAFNKILSLVYSLGKKFSEGIHATAVIAEDVEFGENVSIGACVVIEQGVKIGKNTVIYSGTYIGHQAVIGDHCLIDPNVTIQEKSILGDHVIVHSGSVIGSDGFGYTQVKGVHEKIPQVGMVEIEDHVEIGANVTIDRARFDKTIIGRGTKIDNLVQIAHNVKMGKNCLIISQVGISGSVTIEDNVILAGQVGVGGHLTIGKEVLVTAKSAVMKSVPAKTKVSGIPVRPYVESKKALVYMYRFSQYVKELKELRKKVEDLESKAKNN